MTQSVFPQSSRRLVVAVIAATGAWLVPSAAAAMTCNGAYQVNSKGEFWSPYCHAEALSLELRSQGRIVSADDIRNRISVLGEVCRSAGSGGGSGCAAQNRRSDPPPPPAPETHTPQR